MARQAHEIDYRIFGNDMQAVTVTLDPGESVIAEAGAMLYMTDGVDMQTSMSTDKEKGLLGNLVKAVGRKFMGESFFITTFENTAAGRADVSFGAPYPGHIVDMDMQELGGTLICQKDSFLCAAQGTDVSVEFNKKLGAGLFGGEGFILQRLEGDGMAFVHAGGTVFKMDLAPNQTVRVDTGCLAAFVPSVTYDIQLVKGFKNMLFGGEGIVFATLTGPGRVWLQTLPFSRLAGRVMASIPHMTGRKGEGSILGGLGNVLDGVE